MVCAIRDGKFRLQKKEVFHYFITQVMSQRPSPLPSPLSVTRTLTQGLRILFELIEGRLEGFLKGQKEVGFDSLKESYGESNVKLNVDYL